MLTPWRRLAFGAIAASALTATGTVGYITIEGFGFFDALFQAVTVVTTAGFGQVKPLGDAGRAFTMGLIVLGIIVVLYVLTAVMQIAVEGEIENLLGTRRKRSRLARLQGHHVICGFGRVGEEAARTLAAHDVRFVVVDSNPEAVERARKRSYLLIEGDATSDAVLREARVEHARCLLAASDSDAGNAFTVLAAKALNSHLFVVARAAHAKAEAVMTRAGAARVFPIYNVAGRQMAAAALRPPVAEIIDLLASQDAGEPVLAEIEIDPGSDFAGKTVADVCRLARSAVVLGIESTGGALAVDPAAGTVLKPGDRLIVRGAQDDLDLLGPGARAPTRDTE